MTQHFTAADKATAAKREAGMRRRVYQRWVADGKMTQANADKGIAIMDEIAADYDRQAQGERLL